MKHAPWVASVLALAMASGAFALGADDQSAAPAAGQSVSSSTLAAATAPAQPASPIQQAIFQLRQERQAYVSSFDWTQGSDRAALQADYAGHMKAFDVRELELKRDWYQTTNQTDLLARTQESLRRLTQPAVVLPEIARDHQAAAGQSPEVTR